MESSNPYESPRSDVRPEVRPMSGQPATRLQRLFAALIDSTAVLSLVVPTNFALGFYVIDGYSVETRQAFAATAVSIGAALALQSYGWSTRAQSIGKMVVGIKIVTLDGCNATVERIVFRRTLPFWLVPLMPVVGRLITLLDGAAIFNPDRRCLHDHLAATKVVQV